MKSTAILPQGRGSSIGAVGNGWEHTMKVEPIAHHGGASESGAILNSRSYENVFASSGKRDRENPAPTIARELNWRLGDSKGEASTSVLNEDGLLTIEVRGDTLAAAGDIDLYRAPEFRERAEAFIRTVPQPRLDLSLVPFLDSAGLATLLALSRIAKSESKTLRLVVTGSPRRVLKITGIDRVLVLED